MQFSIANPAIFLPKQSMNQARTNPNAGGNEVLLRQWAAHGIIRTKRSAVRRISGWLLGARVADLLEGAFEQILALVVDVTERSKCLQRAGGRTSEGELAVGDLALIKGEEAMAKDD